MNEQKKIRSLFVAHPFDTGDFYRADKETQILKEYYSDDCSQSATLECYRVYKNNVLKTEIRTTRNLIIEYAV
jgi:predicted DNA-binding protein YlxM (UPF0122 family)